MSKLQEMRNEYLQLNGFAKDVYLKKSEYDELSEEQKADFKYIDYHDEYYKSLVDEVSHDEMLEIIALNQENDIKSIKKMMVFFTTLTSISIVVGIIFYIYIYNLIK